MSERPGRTNNVVGPAGEPLTVNNLPAANTRRWVIRRKAEVVIAVRAGLISCEDACERYRLSLEEFQSWVRVVDMHGLLGLRTTKLQEYRERVQHEDGIVLNDPKNARASHNCYSSAGRPAISSQ